MLKTLFGRWVQGGWVGFVRDGLAGLSLACMNIPQVLGYARIACMPAVTGLYTVLLPLVAFAGLGSSRHLVVAADSATAAIFSSALTPMAPPSSARYMALVSMVALLSAGLLLVARLFRLGFLADFLSRTVLVGFMAGVGVQVGIAMAYDMLGLQVTAHNPLVQGWDLLRGVPHLVPLSAALSVGMCVVLFAGKKFAPRMPVALVLVVGGMLASWAFGLEARGVALVGPLTGGLPSLHIPQVSWADILTLFPVAMSCVFVIITQSAATSRTYAYEFQENVDENRDILGLCAANALAGLSGTFTVNGSPTQTAMAVQAGARSQKAQMVFACVTLIVLLFLTAPLHYLPRCVLGAIVFSVAMGMIDLRALRHIRQESPGEFRLALMTAATVVGVGVEEGILVAIGLSLVRHVRHSYEPHTMVLEEDAQGKLLEESVVKAGIETEPGLIVYRFCADLFYANCNRFADDIRFLIRTASSPVRCVVVDACAITDIDYSAACLLRNVLQELQTQSVLVVFGRVNPFLHEDMDRHGISIVVGEGNIYPQLHKAVEAARSHARCEKT